MKAAKWIPLALLLLIPAVGIITVLRERRESRPVATGILERDRITLPARASERITEILVREGQAVEAGQILMKQEAIRGEINYKAAKADRDSAAAHLEKLRNGPRPEEIRQVEALLHAAEGVLEEREKNLERAERLTQQNFSSAAERDAAHSLWVQALGSRDELAARLALLQQGSRREDLEMAGAALDAAEARLALAALSLEDLILRAPRRGTIDSLPLETGSTPQPGQTLAILLAEEAPHARIYIPQEWHSRLKTGTRLPVLIDGFSREFTGLLERISPDPVFTPYFALNQSDRGHLSYVGTIRLTDPEAADLTPGSPVRVPLDGDPGGLF